MNMLQRTVLKSRSLLDEKKVDVDAIRSREYMGIVADEASTEQFNFFIAPPKGVSILKGTYVIVDHPIFGEMCPLLAVIREIKNDKGNIIL